MDLLKILMGQGIKDAVGRPGEPGNSDYILYIAERVIGVYKAVGEWSLEFKKYIVPEEFCRLLTVMAEWGKGVKDGIEDFIPMAREKMQLVLLNHEEGVNLTMTIGLDDALTTEVNKEFNKLAAAFGR